MATLWLGKFTAHIGINGRGDNGDNPPWLGFYYGSWLPVVSVHNEWAASLNWRWLCFHGYFTWYTHSKWIWFWQRWKFRPKA